MIRRSDLSEISRQIAREMPYSETRNRELHRLDYLAVQPFVVIEGEEPSSSPVFEDSPTAEKCPYCGGDLTETYSDVECTELRGWLCPSCEVSFQTWIILKALPDRREKQTARRTIETILLGCHEMDYISHFSFSELPLKGKIRFLVYPIHGEEETVKLMLEMALYGLLRTHSVRTWDLYIPED